MSIENTYNRTNFSFYHVSKRGTYKEALAEIFPSKAVALQTESNAAAGDDEAMVQLWKFYNQRYEVSYDDGGSTPQFVYEAHALDNDLAAYYANKARAAGNLETEVFHKQVNEGGSRISRRGYRIVQSPFNILSASGSIYEFDTNDGRAPYSKINHALYYWGPDKMAEAYLAVRDYAVPALIECAKAGDPSAANELSRLYSEQTINYKADTWFNRNKKINNPIYSSRQAEEWAPLAKVMSGYDKYVSGPIQEPEGLKAASVAALDKFIFSQNKTLEGLYNIGIALTRTDTQIPRHVYNRRIGNKDIDSLDAGIDFLKHAANLGNAFAARELGNLYRAKRIAPATTDPTDKDYAQAAAYWYQQANNLADSKESAVAINARHRIGLLEKEFGPLDLQAYGNKPENVNPSKRHMEEYPASIALFPNTESFVSDYSYLADANQGSITQRLERGIADTNKTLAELNDITDAFEQKLMNLGLSEAEKSQRIAQAKEELEKSYESNDKIIREVNSQREIAREAMRRWRSEQLGYSVASLIVATTMPALAVSMTAGDILAKSILSGVPRGSSYYQAGASAVSGAEAKIADLLIGYKNIDLTKEQIAELTQDLTKLQQSKEAQALIRDSKTVEHLQLAYLRRQLLYVGQQNADILDDYAKRGADAPGSVDALLAGLETSPSNHPHQHEVHQALTNFCFGFADSDDLHLILAYADSIKTPANAAEKTLKQWTEDHLKPTISEYIAKANRVDALKDIPISLTSNSVELSAAVEKHEPISALARNNFATGGNKYISEMFAFYLTRNGGSHFHDAHLRDDHRDEGSIIRQAPKSVDLISHKEIQKYNEQAMLAANYGRPKFPQPDNLFMRICAAEYFEPQNVSTKGDITLFKDHPQAPASYPMVHDVVNNFIERMSLSPLATVYREKLHDKELVDSLIAQSFTDFFAIIGQVHAEKFKDARTKLAQSYNNQNYGSQFQFTYAKLRDDAVERYETFQEIFISNVNKMLEVSSNKDSDQLIQDLRQLKEEGVDLFKLDQLIYPGSVSHFQDLANRSRRHSNLGINLTAGK